MAIPPAPGAPTGPQPPPKSGKERYAGRRISRRLLTLGSAAVAAAYAVGYVRTEPASERLNAQVAQAQALIHATPGPAATPTQDASTAVVTAITTVVPSPTEPAPTATPTPRFRDGSYVGTGSSRHGDVEATVVIKGGQIASAEIDRCMTRYSCSVISALPGQVIQQQSENVDLVSGATDSSIAYQGAIADALAKAR